MTCVATFFHFSRRTGYIHNIFTFDNFFDFFTFPWFTPYFWIGRCDIFQLSTFFRRELGIFTIFRFLLLFSIFLMNLVLFSQSVTFLSLFYFSLHFPYFLWLFLTFLYISLLFSFSSLFPSETPHISYPPLIFFHDRSYDHLLPPICPTHPSHLYTIWKEVIHADLK